MKRSISKDHLREAHTSFKTDHERLRTELLATLANCTPAPSSSHQLAWRSTLMTVAASACVAIVIVTWIAMSGVASRPVYAIDGLQERFRHIRSLYLKGNFYDTNVVNGKEEQSVVPFERFAERSTATTSPRYFLTKAESTVKIVNGKTKSVDQKNGFTVVDGNRSLEVSTTGRTAVRSQINQIGTELRVESLLQNEWWKDLIHGPTDRYQFVGTEVYRNQKTLRYEFVKVEKKKERSRYIIWLNPATGLPLRAAIYEVDAGGTEQPSAIYETIEIDAAPPTNVFSLDAPVGYRLIETDGAKKDYHIASAGDGHGNIQSAVRHGLAIDRLAVLVWWYCETNAKESTTPEEYSLPAQVELQAPSRSRTCELIPIRSQLEAGKLWRLSLAVPQDHQPVNLDEVFVIKIKNEDGESTFSGSPLRLDDERLARILARIQELGTPVGEPQPEMTLAGLRWVALRFLTKARVDSAQNDGKK